MRLLALARHKAEARGRARGSFYSGRLTRSGAANGEARDACLVMQSSWCRLDTTLPLARRICLRGLHDESRGLWALSHNLRDGTASPSWGPCVTAHTEDSDPPC